MNNKEQESQAETWEISTAHKGEEKFPKEWLSTGAGHPGDIQSSTRQGPLTSESALL